MGPVTVHLPSRSYVYNLREHRLLGHVSQVEGTLTEGSPLFLAFSPEPPGRLSINSRGAEVDRLQVKAGGTAAFHIQMSMPDGHSNFPDAVHVDVRNPAGKVVFYHGRNLQLKNGLAKLSIALALNDQPGQWQVTLREPYTHQACSATFRVVR